MKKMLIVGLGIAICGCDDAVTGAVEDVCGACPDVAEGELLVTGSAQIDGLFKALNIFQNASVRITGEFEAHVAAIGDAFGVERGDMSLGDYAAAVQLAVEAEISANLDGGISVNYVPPQCSANVNVMVEAKAECTASADVECTPPKVTPGMIEVACEGQCTGGCTGSCSGSCAVEATGGKCTASCEGGCDLTVAGMCNGTCNGSCSGTCEVQDSSGNCKGKCDGMCTGSCELAVAASCSGTCTGKCVEPMVMASCEGECRGECDASCTGSCTGSATPPSVTPPDCDAEVDAQCNASASAQASASLECTPPRLDIDYAFAAGINATAQAEFLAKFSVFRREVIGIIQGFSHATILFEGDTDLGIPAIQDVLSAQIQGFAELDFEAFGNITPFGAICALDGVPAAVEQVGSAAADLSATVNAQVGFVTIVLGG